MKLRIVALIFVITPMYKNQRNYEIKCTVIKDIIFILKVICVRIM